MPGVIGACEAIDFPRLLHDVCCFNNYCYLCVQEATIEPKLFVPGILKNVMYVICKAFEVYDSRVKWGIFQLR